MSVCAEAVFKDVFDRCQKPLQVFLQARGMVMHKAADSVQDCFVKLWNNCTKVERDKAKSYLFTIASRLHIDEYRKAEVRLKYRRGLSPMVVKEDGQYKLEEQEFKYKLEQTINNMTDKNRAVFLLNRFEKKTYKEIAESLDISVKAVEKRMSAALKRLYQENIFQKK